MVANMRIFHSKAIGLSVKQNDLGAIYRLVDCTPRTNKRLRLGKRAPQTRAAEDERPPTTGRWLHQPRGPRARRPAAWASLCLRHCSPAHPGILMLSTLRSPATEAKISGNHRGGGILMAGSPAHGQVGTGWKMFGVLRSFSSGAHIQSGLDAIWTFLRFSIPVMPVPSLWQMSQ